MGVRYFLRNITYQDAKFICCLQYENASHGQPDDSKTLDPQLHRPSNPLVKTAKLASNSYLLMTIYQKSPVRANVCYLCGPQLCGSLACEYHSSVSQLSLAHPKLKNCVPLPPVAPSHLSGHLSQFFYFGSGRMDTLLEGEIFTSLENTS